MTWSWSAAGRQVVDATGSATVAALAGAERVREPNDTRQPGSFFFWIDSQGLEFDADEVNRNYKEAIEKGEMLPSDVHVGMSWFIRKGGVTAALAARRHCDPRDVPLDMIKKQLTGIGHLVPQQDHRTSQTIHRENGAIHRLKS
jgi:hypothetical protein